MFLQYHRSIAEFSWQCYVVFSGASGFGASAGECGFCTSSSYVAYCSYTGSGAPVSERNDRAKTLQAKERV